MEIIASEPMPALFVVCALATLFLYAAYLMGARTTRAADELGSLLRDALPASEIDNLVSRAKAHSGGPSDYFRTWFELDEKWSVAGAKLALDRLEDRLLGVQKLSRILIDPAIEQVDTEGEDDDNDNEEAPSNTSPDERAVHDLIEQNLWIFEPDFACDSSRKASDQGMTKVARNVFNSASNLGEAHRWTKRVKDFLGVRWKPDVIVRADVSASLNPAHALAGATQTTLLLEFKAPRVPIDRSTRVQVGKYALELLNLGLINKTMRTECLAIGSRITDDDWHGTGPSPGTPVTVSPISFARLVTRAKKLSLDLYDGLEGVAPFLLTEKRT